MIRNNHNQVNKKRECYFCVENVPEIDYKDALVLQKFLSSYAKILPRRKTGVCSKHQRKLAQAIKRARVMNLLPFIKV